MRVAFFSPLPPSRSGIADYSEALIDHIKPLADVEAFSAADPGFDPGRFDVVVYQLGNNPHHGFVYETALRHPGVVVMHESNLHHLITDLTIGRNDWDAYLRECEYQGGAEALAFARRVRALEVGPDYEGLPMTRRVLGSARAVVVHSQFMVDSMRSAGFRGPIGCIPHGAWIPEASRSAWRHRLGLDEVTPLIGIFGFLKPYKRIAESLRALRRLLRVVPAAKMILVGEPHPDFPLQSIIQSLGLSAAVRILGFTPIQDFTGYMAACDVVLNLRYPTVGESSGSLLRALGLGKPVLVSDIGAFREFPDDVCLKVPVGEGEENLIYEYMNLLASRPDVARSIGDRAARYVREECNWDRVAALYTSFLESVVKGEPWHPPERADAAPQMAAAPKAPPATIESIRSWAADRQSEAYLDTHADRLVKTLALTPPGGPEDRILEMGAYLQITPALHNHLGYGCVRGCYYGPLGKVDHKTVVSADGETFTCDVDLFDAEKDRYPYPDGHFATVLCCELIEHLTEDPMHLMSEIHRILRPGGHLVLTTPNISSLHGVAAVLEGYHPGIFTAYIRPQAGSGEVEARHNREYTPKEIQRLLENSGFTVIRLETGPFRETPRPEEGWVLNLLERFNLPTDLRGEDIYAVGRKTGPVRVRYPDWLYA